jgi:hypothetical protein
MDFRAQYEENIHVSNFTAHYKKLNSLSFARNFAFRT